nr:hypothetical protein HK105_006190 [Polyrhizophydium stewartii]
MNNLQLRISELQEKLQDRSEQHAVPKLGPDSLDFDNEQWIQYFMDELKLRTIRGTNATKALQTIGKEKEELEAKLVDAEAELRVGPVIACFIGSALHGSRKNSWNRPPLMSARSYSCDSRKPRPLRRE